MEWNSNPLCKLDSNSIRKKWYANWLRKYGKFAHHFHHL